MLKHTAVTLTALSLVLAGCATPAKVSTGSTPAARVTYECIMPKENVQIGAYLSVFEGKEPVALGLAPGYAVPIKQAAASYNMMVVLPSSFDATQFRAKVESDTWQFAPNSGAANPPGDAFVYQFAVQPKEGAPRPGSMKISFENVTEPPAGKPLEPVTLQVFGPGEPRPDCAVNTLGPAPSANPTSSTISLVDAPWITAPASVSTFSKQVRLEFSTAVDRPSVEERVKAELKEFPYRTEWAGDRSLLLSLQQGCANFQIGGRGTGCPGPSATAAT